MAAGFKTAQVNASSVPSTQTSFPVYVDLSRLGITTLAEAQSVRVYADSSKTTEWAREIVSATEMHVKVPSLTNTVSIYVDWDGTSADYAATDTYGRNAVWSDYAGVWHLDTNSNDSTANGLNGTDTAITYASGNGKFGGGADFNGSTSIINLGTSSLLNFATASFTLSSWAYPTGNSTIYGIINKRANSAPNAGYALGYDWTSNDKFSLNLRSTVPTAYELDSTVSTPTNTAWYKVTGVYDSSAVYMYLYVNGTQNSKNVSGRASITNSESTYIGAVQQTGLKWLGDLDEIRVRNSTVSQDWETTEYNNQSDEAGFWGTWSNVSGGATFVPKSNWFM